MPAATKLLRKPRSDSLFYLFVRHKTSGVNVFFGLANRGENGDFLLNLVECHFIRKLLNRFDYGLFFGHKKNPPVQLYTGRARRGSRSVTPSFAPTISG